MIKVFHTLKDITHYRSSLNLRPCKIGLVPTMGNLHAGHLTLLEKSISENDVSIITIFVNPKQFGPTEDFNNYPRTLNEDIQKISSLAIQNNKEIVLFAPLSEKEIYPEGFSTSISVGPITTILCGKYRPTHFDGVTTVVYKLFSLLKPTQAYFGQKDYQQCVIIKRMVRDLDLEVKIHIEPISRNQEGLALSSRNQYLTAEELKQALTLSKTLREIQDLILSHSPYLAYISEIFKKDELTKHWDYLEVLDASDLTVPTTQTTQVVIVGAYRIRQTRLLDNLITTYKHLGA